MDLPALSIREACMLHTISKADFFFEQEAGTEAKFTTIRDTLGESIPPLVLKIIVQNLQKIATNTPFILH